jgi:5-methyltetrahydrofolate--homocysteine methyltransferase
MYIYFPALLAQLTLAKPSQHIEKCVSPECVSDVVDEFVVWLTWQVGGCCGTTPPHIKAIADIVKGIRPRQVNKSWPYMRLSGLEDMTITPERNFINVGERCNIAGSLAFKKMILNGEFDKALAVARKQVEDGAQILDINLDDGLLDGHVAMRRYSETNSGVPP